MKKLSTKKKYQLSLLLFSLLSYSSLPTKMWVCFSYVFLLFPSLASAFVHHSVLVIFTIMQILKLILKIHCNWFAYLLLNMTKSAFGIGLCERSSLRIVTNCYEMSFVASFVFFSCCGSLYSFQSLLKKIDGILLSFPSKNKETRKQANKQINGQCVNLENNKTALSWSLRNRDR